MTSPQKILTIGDSPCCSFISWRLAQGDWKVTLVGSTSYDPSDKSVSWRSENLGDSKYNPVAFVSSINDIESSLGANNRDPFDVVLVSVSALKDFKIIANQLQNFIDKTSLILVDSGFAIRLEHEFKKSMVNKNVPIFGIICEAEVRIIKSKSFKGYQHLGHNTTTVIGTTSETDAVVNTSLKGMGHAGQKLNLICDSLKEAQVKSCYLIPKGLNPTFSTHAWRKIIPYVAFEGLILIYKRLNTSDVLVAPVIKGTFVDVITVAKKAGVVDIPDTGETSKITAYFDTAVKEFNNKHPHNIIGPTKQKTEECTVESALAFYNYCNEIETYIELAIMQIILLADDYQIKLPYLECVVSFYKLCEEMRRINIGELGCGYPNGNKPLAHPPALPQNHHRQTYPNQMNPPPQGYIGKGPPIQPNNSYQQQRKQNYPPYQNQYVSSPLGATPIQQQQQQPAYRGGRFQQSPSPANYNNTMNYNPCLQQQLHGYGPVQGQNSTPNAPASFMPLQEESQPLQQTSPPLPYYPSKGSDSPLSSVPVPQAGTSENSPPITSVPSAFPQPLNYDSIPATLHHPRFDNDNRFGVNGVMRSSPSQNSPLPSTQQSPAELRDNQMNVFRNGNVRNAFDPKGNRYGDVDSFAHGLIVLDNLGKIGSSILNPLSNINTIASTSNITSSLANTTLNTDGANFVTTADSSANINTGNSTSAISNPLNTGSSKEISTSGSILSGGDNSGKVNGGIKSPK